MSTGNMEDDQQFCLRWNNHQSTLISVFDTLLEKGIHVDCTLAAEGKTLKAHKVVLSACSPYFEAVLSQQYDKHPIIILKDVKFAEMRAMMDYMYRGEVNISQDQLGALLKAAESLQIKGLSDSKPPAGRPHSPAVKQRSLRASPAPENGPPVREGSSSPTRRRKKKPRSASPPAETPRPVPTLNNNVNSHSDRENAFVGDAAPPEAKANAIGDPGLKREFDYENESAEDLTMDEVDSEVELSGAGTSNVPNDSTGLNWTMDRSQDENAPEGNVQDVEEDAKGKEKKVNEDIPIMDLDEVFDDDNTQSIVMEEEEPTKKAILKSMALKFDSSDRKESDKIPEKMTRLSKKLSEQKSDSTDSSQLEDKNDLTLPCAQYRKGSGYECPKCLRIYNARKNLVRHMNLECGREPQYKCPHCPHGNHRRNELKRHIQKKHSDGKE